MFDRATIPSDVIALDPMSNSVIVLLYSNILAKDIIPFVLILQLYNFKVTIDVLSTRAEAIASIPLSLTSFLDKSNSVIVTLWRNVVVNLCKYPASFNKESCASKPSLSLTLRRKGSWSKNACSMLFTSRGFLVLLFLIDIVTL